MSKDEKHSGAVTDLIADIKQHGGRSSDIEYLREELAALVAQTILLLYVENPKERQRVFASLVQRYPSTLKRVERGL